MLSSQFFLTFSNFSDMPSTLSWIPNMNVPFCYFKLSLYWQLPFFGNDSFRLDIINYLPLGFYLLFYWQNYLSSLDLFFYFVFCFIFIFFFSKFHFTTFSSYSINFFLLFQNFFLTKNSETQPSPPIHVIKTLWPTCQCDLRLTTDAPLTSEQPTQHVL